MFNWLKNTPKGKAEKDFLNLLKGAEWLIDMIERDIETDALDGKEPLSLEETLLACKLGIQQSREEIKPTDKDANPTKVDMAFDKFKEKQKKKNKKVGKNKDSYYSAQAEKCLKLAILLLGPKESEINLKHQAVDLLKMGSVAIDNSLARWQVVRKNYEGEEA